LKNYLILTWKQYPILLKPDGYFWEIYVYLQLGCIVLFEQSEHFCSLKILLAVIVRFKN
jgi:hypothetical protein